MFAMRCADQVHESLRLKFRILKHPHYQGAEKMNSIPVLIFSIHELCLARREKYSYCCESLTLWYANFLHDD